jgi:hypothetical protein
MTLVNFKPAVPVTWLLALAGTLWAAAGLLLGRLAVTWLRPLPLGRALVLGALGLALAVGSHRWLFRGLARRNIARIGRYADKGCLFAFQAWRSYLVIALMVALGVALRHSALPREGLAVLYIAMGGALGLGSLAYFRHLWGRRQGQDPPHNRPPGS